MSKKPTLLYVTTRFRTGAIPHIIHDTLPIILGNFNVVICSLEVVDSSCNVFYRIRQLGVPIVDIGAKRRDVFTSIIGLARIAKRLKPALIHSHLGRADQISALVGKLSRIPVITHFHTPKSNYHPFTKLAYHLTHHLVDLRFSNSLAVDSSWFPRRDRERQSECNTVNHQVIYNPVNLGIFHPPLIRSVQARGETATAIYVGKLRKPKGQIRLLDHFSKIREKFPGHRLWLIGDGPDEKKIRQKIKSLKLQSYVELKGLREDVPQLLRSADYFLASPISEGFSIAHLEAMAAGLPIITSVTPAMEEYILAGENALIFHGDDPYSSTAKVKELFENPRLRDKLILNGLHMAETFNSTNIALQLVKYYLSVIRNRGYKNL